MNALLQRLAIRAAAEGAGAGSWSIEELSELAGLRGVGRARPDRLRRQSAWSAARTSSAGSGRSEPGVSTRTPCTVPSKGAGGA